MKKLIPFMLCLAIVAGFSLSVEANTIETKAKVEINDYVLDAQINVDMTLLSENYVYSSQSQSKLILVASNSVGVFNVARLEVEVWPDSNRDYSQANDRFKNIDVPASFRWIHRLKASLVKS